MGAEGGYRDNESPHGPELHIGHCNESRPLLSWFHWHGGRLVFGGLFPQCFCSDTGIDCMFVSEGYRLIRDV